MVYLELGEDELVQQVVLKGEERTGAFSFLHEETAFFGHGQGSLNEGFGEGLCWQGRWVGGWVGGKEMV